MTMSESSEQLTKGARIRASLPHPLIDGDSHTESAQGVDHQPRVVGEEDSAEQAGAVRQGGRD